MNLFTTGTDSKSGSRKRIRNNGYDKMATASVGIMEMPDLVIPKTMIVMKSVASIPLPRPLKSGTLTIPFSLYQV